MEKIFSWVQNVVVFLIVLTLVNELLPSKDYEKYIRVAAGMILILIIAVPILDLINARGSMDYYFSWESMKTLLTGNVSWHGNLDEAALESQRTAMIMEEYVKNLEAQVRETLKSEGFCAENIEFVISENTADEEFGRILSMNIRGLSCIDETPGTGETTEDTLDIHITVDKVEPVNVGEQSFKPKARPEDILALKQKLSADYGLELGAISVN